MAAKRFLTSGASQATDVGCMVMLPNWFIALPVEPNVVAGLPPVPAGVRAFHPGDVHLTLSFLGACGEATARHAFASLARRLGEEGGASFVISLGEVIALGPKRRYSALSAVVDEGNGAAVAFLRRFRDVVADAAGMKRDQRPPLPHVTVARPQRSATDEQREAALQWAKTVVLSTTGVCLEEVALYTWSERRLPRLFQIVDRVSLDQPVPHFG